MKLIKCMAVFGFWMILLTPVLTFNFEEGAISEIDNRELSTNPFSAEAREKDDLTGNIENYVEDRIGFRDDMILAYTIMNDRVFGKMVHPSYVYGKDGYVFGAGLNVYPCYSEFHEEFADMVLKVQNYCSERNVPFLFVFNPAKPAVLTRYIPEGQNYDRDWVGQFLATLDERGVHYIDNTGILCEKTAEGEAVFNKKYDANHWNDLGALYGANQILKSLQAEIPQVHVNNAEDIIYDEVLKTTLLVSEFPINEMVPNISINMQWESVSEDYREELFLDENYHAFEYFRNPIREEEGSPRALVFQGSYMNEYGYKYLMNGFSEYIYVHDYQNIINFPYYYNIFKPECVVFEVAEYTLENGYFDRERMRTMALNPTLESVLNKGGVVRSEDAVEIDLIIEKGSKLTKIMWEPGAGISYGWLKLDEENVYDLLREGEAGYSVTILTEKYEQYKETMEILYY